MSARKVWSVSWNSPHDGKFVFTAPSGAKFKREGITLRGCGHDIHGYSLRTAQEFVKYLNSRG